MKTKLFYIVAVCVVASWMRAAKVPVGKPDKSVAELTADLAMPLAPLRREAADGLGRMGPEARAATPALIKALQDEDELVRSHAAWALGKIGSSAQDIVPALITALETAETSWAVRHNAALSLSWIGAPAVPALRKGLASKMPWARVHCADVLVRIGGDSPSRAELLEVVTPLCEDKDASVRAFAVTVAGSMGADAKRAVRALIARLDDDNVAVRMNTTQALANIGPAAEEAFPRLLKVLREDGETWVRVRAVLALAAVAPSRAETIEALVATFTDRKDRVGSYAVQALAKIGAPAMPALCEALGSNEKKARVFAAEALAFMGAQAAGEKAAAAASLIPVLSKDEEWEVRSLAAAAMGYLGVAREDVVTTLRRAQNDEHSMVRLNADDALRRLGQPVRIASAGEGAGR